MIFSTEIHSAELASSAENILERLEKRLIQNSGGYSKISDAKNTDSEGIKFIERELNFSYPEIKIDSPGPNDLDLEKIGIEISKIEAQIQLLNGDVNSLSQRLASDLKAQPFVELKVSSPPTKSTYLESFELYLNGYRLINSQDHLDSSLFTGDNLVYAGPLSHGTHELKISAKFRTLDEENSKMVKKRIFSFEGSANLSVAKDTAKKGYRIKILGTKGNNHPKMVIEDYEI